MSAATSRMAMVPVPSRGASVAIALALATSGCGSAAGDGADESLRAVYERARACELLQADGDYPGFVDDAVTDPDLQCLHRCLARLSCEDLAPIFCGSEPLVASACAKRCYTDACADGTPLPASFSCDGFDDCADHSDERGCATFTCSDGQVVPQSFVCSGFPDCVDGSDERDCPAPAPTPTFACGDGVMLPLTQRCDGISHCGDESDERDCAAPLCTAP